jgi:hypothetical protein
VESAARCPAANDHTFALGDLLPQMRQRFFVIDSNWRLKQEWSPAFSEAYS